MASKIDVKQRWKPKPVGIEGGTPYGMSISTPTSTLPERAGALPERLQDIARNYLGARRQSGVSLLEAARWLSEARTEAKHGEWAIFLEAISLDESRARAQIRIHEEALANPVFADRIVNGFLSETVARELLPLPAEKREELLTRETPPTREDVRNTKRVPAPDFNQPTLPDMPPPLTPADLPPEYAIIQRRYIAQGYQLLSNIQGYHRAFVTRKEGMTGIVTFDWADVLSKLERLEAQATSATPARRTCPTCGAPILNGIWGDLNECGVCYHARQRAPTTPAEQEQPNISGVAVPSVTLAQLGSILPRTLEKVGYFWKAASPPTIAHNDGWTGDAPTVEGALALAHDREKTKDEPITVFPALNQAECRALIREAKDLIARGIDTKYPTIAKALRIAARMALEATD